MNTTMHEKFAQLLENDPEHDCPGLGKDHICVRLAAMAELPTRFGDFHIQGGYDLIKELLELGKPPTIVFISNHYTHIGATKYLMEHRDSVDPEFSIASFDDMELSSVLGFCKVRAAQPVTEIGSEAARLLMSRINREENGPPRILRLKTRLVTG